MKIRLLKFLRIFDNKKDPELGSSIVLSLLMNRQNQFNLEQLVELIVVDPSLMAGDYFSAGVQAGTFVLNDIFASSIGIIYGFIAQNNAEFVLLRIRPKSTGLSGSAYLIILEVR